MLVDRTHVRWMAFTGLATFAATGLYVWYAQSAPGGPTGGSVPGLWFGVGAAGLMLFCGLLTLRKKLPRITCLGPAQTWLRAHIWLGLFTLPLVLFHAGFRWGGMLEQGLLVVYGLVMASGLLGLLMQQYVPHALRSGVAREAMFDQIPHVCRRLRQAADELVEKHFGSLLTAFDAQADPNTYSKSEVVVLFYLTKVRGTLEHTGASNHSQAALRQASELLRSLQTTLPEPLAGPLARLGELLAERSELQRQEVWHARLHGWLAFHLAFSVALLILGAVHALMSVYF